MISFKIHALTYNGKVQRGHINPNQKMGNQQMGNHIDTVVNMDGLQDRIFHVSVLTYFIFFHKI